MVNIYTKSYMVLTSHKRLTSYENAEQLETCARLPRRGYLQEAKATPQLGDVDIGATLAKAQLLETVAQ